MTSVYSLLPSKIFQHFANYFSDEIKNNVYRCALNALNFLNEQQGKLMACFLLPCFYKFYLISFVASDALIFTIFTAAIIAPVAITRDAVVRIHKANSSSEVIRLSHTDQARLQAKLLKKLCDFEDQNDQIFIEKVAEMFEKKDYAILQSCSVNQISALYELAQKTLKKIKERFPASFQHDKVADVARELLPLLEQMEKLTFHNRLVDYREDVRVVIQDRIDNILKKLKEILHLINFEKTELI